MPKSAVGVRSTHITRLRTETTSIDARTELLHGPAAPSHARRFIRQALAQWGCEAMAETVTLLTNELVTNAVLHADSDITVMVCVHNGVLRVEVDDGSTRAPSNPHYGGDAQTGRGLTLVEKASDAWGVTKRSGGKTVWFEVSL